MPATCTLSTQGLTVSALGWMGANVDWSVCLPNRLVTAGFGREAGGARPERCYASCTAERRPAEPVGADATGGLEWRWQCSRSSSRYCWAGAVNVGRDPDQIELSVQARANYDDLAATVATLQPLVEAGATHLILMLTYPYPDGIVAQLADEVVGRVG